MAKSSSHRRTTRATPQSRKAPSPRKLPGQIALRVAQSAEQRVRRALAKFGKIESYAPAGILILHANGDASPTEIRRVVEELRRECLVEYVTPVLHDPGTGKRQILTDEITVRLRPETPQKGALSEMRRDEGVSIARRNEFVPTQYTLRVSEASGTRTLQVAKRLQKRADVEFAAPNYIVDVKR